MNDAIGGMIVGVLFFFVCGAVLIIFFTNRHKERMSMIEKGFLPEQMRSKSIKPFTTNSQLSSLKLGIIAVAIGLAITTAIILENFYSMQNNIGGLYPALIFLYSGVGLIVYYIIAAKKIKETEDKE